MLCTRWTVYKFLLPFLTRFDILNKFCANFRRPAISLHGYTYRRYYIIRALPYRIIISLLFLYILPLLRTYITTIDCVFRTFQIFFFLTSYAIPLAIICILYVLMLMRLWKGVNPGGQPPSAESRRGKKRVTRMVVVVVAIFAFCWFPIQVRTTIYYNIICTFI